MRGVKPKTFLLMCVEPDSDDIVAAGGVVALKILAYARVLLAGELLRNYRELLHEVARRRHAQIAVEVGRWLLHRYPERIDQVASVYMPIPEEPELDELKCALDAPSKIPLLFTHHKLRQMQPNG
jgi:hypothetical protein